MPGITDLDVTYGGALAAGGFHRITRPNGTSAELNHGATGTPSYLWSHEGENRGAPIVELQVLHGEEPVPEGFEKVGRNLLKGADAQVFLCARRATDIDPIGKMHILYDSEQPEQGFEKLARSLNPASEIFLAVQRVSKDAPVKWTGHSLKIGDWVDVRDTINKWCIAQIVSATDTEVTIHYKGWASKWDEPIPRDSPRLAELGTQTRGQDTGWTQRAQGTSLTITVEEILSTSRRIQAHINGSAVDDHFWRGDVPQFVEELLTSSFANPAVVPAVNRFLQEMLALIAAELSNSDPILPSTMLLLNRLFDNDRRCTWYYEKYGYGYPEDRSLSSADFVLDGPFAKAPKGSSAAQEYSRLFVTNVNYFGSQGGFDAILRRLEPSYEPASSLMDIQSLLALLRAAVGVYNPSWAREYFNRLQAVVFGRLLNLRNEEIKELQDADKDTVDLILLELEKLLAFTLKDFPVYERTETLQVALSKRLLTCPFLSMRIKGMTLLVDLVDMAKRKDMPRTYATGYTYQSRAPLPTTKWVTTAWLAEWIAGQDVLDIALGDTDALRRYNLEDTHVELVKRSEDLLIFLAKFGKLTTRHIDLLWGATVNQPDQQKRAVYKILSGITAAMSPELLDFVGMKLNQVTVGQFDDLYIELVRGVAEGAFSKPGGVTGDADYGLSTLWSLAQEAAQVTDEIRTLAADAVAAVLSKPAAKHQLVRYCESCIQQITERRSPTFSITLLQKLINALPEMSSQSGPVVLRESLINHLQHHHNLLTVVVDELLAFHAAAKQQGVNNDLSRMEKNVTYEGALNTRLDFLRFLMESSPIDLKISEVQSLWTALIGNPVTNSDPNRYLAWLAQICPEEYIQGQRRGGVFQCLEDSTILYIFTDLLGAGILSDTTSETVACPLGLLQEDGYLCLEKFFRYVCGRQKRMLYSYNKLYFTVESDELPGFDIILEAFLQATSDAVVKAAAEFIVNLQVKLSPRLVRREIWEAFTRKCLDLARKDVSDQYRNRVLVILTKFLEEIKKPQAASTSYSSAATNPRLDEQRVNVFWRKETPGQTNVSGSRSLIFFFKRGTVSVGALRSRIAKDLKHPANQVRLLGTSRAIIPASQDSLMIDRAQISTYADAILLPKPEDDTNAHVSTPPAMTVDEDPNSDQMYPRKILSDDPSCLNLLFDLLSNPVAMDSAWSLLELLPTNTVMQEQLASLSGARSDESITVSWVELLDGSQPVRLLYKLKIIAELIKPLKMEFATAAEQENAKSWCVAFVRTQGVQHLISILLSCDVDTMCAGSLTKACLALLLQMITRFLLPEEELEDDNDKESPTPVAVAEKAVTDVTDGDEFDTVGVDAVPVPISVPTSPPLTKSASLPALALEISIEDILADTDIPSLARRLLAVMHQASISSDKTIADDDNSKKESSRRSRQARIEEYYRNNASQGQQTSTAMDMIDWDDDQETEQQHEELSAEAQVVQHTLSLLVAMTLNQPTILDIVLGFPELSDALLYSLLKTPEGSLRSVVARGIIRLCDRIEREGQSPANRFVVLLMPFLDSARQLTHSCYEYFVLLSKLITKPQALTQVDPERLAATLAQQVVDHPVVEDSEEDEDLLLRGTLILLQSVLASIPIATQSDVKEAVGKTLIKQLFEQCLFAIPQPEVTGSHVARPPKCKHSRSRAAAFSLLAELANNCENNFKQILELVSVHHTIKVPQRKTTKTSSTSLSSSYFFAKSKTGYAGLKNLGCICYMNSSLQQFFMVPSFRQGVLDIEPSSEDPPEESVLAQLQDMFSHLQESEKAYFDPKGFCMAFKDWEGNPVDVMVQQDASEFLTMFFQNIEGLTMGSGSENLLKDCFGGVFSNELIADGGKYSERGEPFYFISVPVQGNKNLYEALDQFVSGETVDYTWEGVDENGQPTKQSLSTTKRVSIKTPPKHLIVHLKRFEFDFEHMQQIKVNDRFEFPMDLDLYPYTIEGRAASAQAQENGDATGKTEETGDMVREYFKYQLSGMVVHMGTANSGHYYSYGRERSGDGNKWFEFNDTYVGEFDPADIEDECFGGEEPITYSYRPVGHTGASQPSTRQKIRNAFMLVYDRVPIKDDANPIDDGLQVQQSRYRANIPARITTELYEENLEYWRVKNIYDQRYYDFMSKLLQQGGPTPAMEVIDLACRFALGTLVHAREKLLLQQWAMRLSDVLGANQPASDWLLSSLTGDEMMLRDLLVGIEDKDTRSGIITLLVAAVQSLTGQLEGVSLEGSFDDLPTVLKFIETMMGLLYFMQLQWKRIGSVFRPLVVLANQSIAARDFMLRRGYIGRLTSFFLATDTPYAELVGGSEPAKSKARAMCDSYSSADYKSTLDILSILIRSSGFPDVKGAPSSAAMEPHYQPSRIEQEMLDSPVFVYRLSKQIKTPARRRSMAAVIEHLVHGRRQTSETFIDVITSSLKKDDGLDLKLPLRAALMLVQLEDELSVWRTDTLLTAINEEAVENSKYVTATEVYAAMLVRMAKASHTVRSWMQRHAADLSWLDRFLNQRKQNGYPVGSMMYKPRRQATGTSSQTYSQQQQYNQNIRYTVHKVAALLRQATQGADLEESYDSDDEPTTLVGKHVRVKWGQEKYYSGTVTTYDEHTGMHRVVYDDGDTRDYIMSDKIWRFENDANV